MSKAEPTLLAEYVARRSPRANASTALVRVRSRVAVSLSIMSLATGSRYLNE